MISGQINGENKKLRLEELNRSYTVKTFKNKSGMYRISEHSVIITIFRTSADTAICKNLREYSPNSAISRILTLIYAHGTEALG